MKLLVGLGNPGPKYQLNRHNIGFIVIDALAENHGGRSFKSEHKALVQKAKIAAEPVILVKPQTYMNLSGESVRSLMDYYQIALSDLLVIQDDIDQPFLGLRFQRKRGHGGHNGIRSLHQHLGSDDYARLKMGVGRPSHPGHDVADYVLADFTSGEQRDLPTWITTACEAVEYFIQHGVDRAANRYNSNGKTQTGSGENL